METIVLRTKIARTIRQLRQGFLTESEAYRAICNAYLERS